MGFRNPVTSATAVETGAGAPGVRIYASGDNPYSGVVEWHAGPSTARGTLTASDTGSGPTLFALQLGTTGPSLELNSEEDPSGGHVPVIRLRHADKIELPPINNGVRVAAVGAAIVGTAPSSGAELLERTFYVRPTANANGDVTVFFPGGGFTNGLLSCHVTAMPPVGNAAAPNWWLPWAHALDRVTLRCYNVVNGAAIPGGIWGASITVTGW